jgi:SPP1 family predicted phage head-tail adaptor
MNIGRLDRKIVIESRTKTVNEYAEPVFTWTPFHTCFANVQMAGGNERFEADTITANNRVKFKIRYFAGINESMRVMYNGAEYQILQIQELHREGLFIWGEKKV